MESRMQELMSSYYDLSDKDETVSQSKNINAPGFLVDDYDMLESMGMDELLRRDDQMIKEIKELDTNMQMLVYENYNKFISATDTIRKMKVQYIPSVSFVLVDSMGKITVQSENVSNALAPFRSKVRTLVVTINAMLTQGCIQVEKLVGVRRLLKRLEFIFQLPQRLKSAMKAQEYDKATKYFVVANRILKRYQHIASFKTIQLEAEHIMFGLRTIVQKKFDDDSTTAPQVQEYAALLLDLNVSVPEVRQRFLNWYQLHFDHFVAAFQDTQPCDTVKYIDAINNVRKKTILLPFLSSKCVVMQAFLPSFATSATAFQAVFGRADVESTAAFGAVATVWFDGYASVCGVGGSGGYGILMLMLKAVIDGIHSLTAPLLPTRDILARTSQLVEASNRFKAFLDWFILRSAGTIVDVPTMDQLAKDTAMAFLHQFALLHSARLNTLLRTAVLTPNWLEPVPGPSRTNSTSGVRDLRRSKQPRTMGSGKQATNSGHMYMDVARLFAKKVHVYHGPDLAISIDSVLSCVFKIACKAYGEYARMATFGRFGVQQVQVDTEWLKVTAATYLTADSSVNEVESLLCDVVTNSMERAIEYTLLEESVLVAIVSTKKGTLKI
ncbi:hypothetical protein DYB35_003506 [Aphanomyces astaci]|uniref:Vacuolar protein sorting-associated protein 51 homolog n=1 Tax=Aphanomyces astaci TaxID=112090 RepID=A0A3R6WWQ9_APHAT|nr:hypothetical protein DYB35_003506 [Aphanomyces astaci]